jgi:hypothetical protein
MLLGAMKNCFNKPTRALEALRIVMWGYVMLIGSYTLIEEGALNDCLFHTFHKIMEVKFKIIYLCLLCK